MTKLPNVRTHISNRLYRSRPSSLSSYFSCSISCLSPRFTSPSSDLLSPVLPARLVYCSCLGLRTEMSSHLFPIPTGNRGSGRPPCEVMWASVGAVAASTYHISSVMMTRALGGARVFSSTHSFGGPGGIGDSLGALRGDIAIQGPRKRRAEL